MNKIAEKPSKRRKLKGSVVSNKMFKTVVVEITRLKKHPKYGKYFKVSKRLKADVENAQNYTPGDEVIIEETRPLSKEKRWRVVGLVRKSKYKVEDFAEHDS